MYFPLLSIRVDLDRTLLWLTGRVSMSYKKQKLLKLHEHHGFILPVFRWFVLFIFSVFCFVLFCRSSFGVLIFSPVFSNVYLIWRCPNIFQCSLFILVIVALSVDVKSGINREVFKQKLRNWSNNSRLRQIYFSLANVYRQIHSRHVVDKGTTYIFFLYIV